MRYRYMMHVVLAILGICTALSQSAVAQTRLGLHVTQEELNIWRQRMNDSVNGINGYSFQDIYQQRIKADADAFRSQSHPGGDGFWVGYTGAGCHPNGKEPNPGSGKTPYGRGNGAYLLRSAFTFLLTGDRAYGDPVRTELLHQMAQAGTDWTNTSKWCVSELGGGPMFEIVPWLHRLLLAFDYLNAGGYTGFSAAEKTQITQWFAAAAQAFGTALRTFVAHGHYLNMFASSPDYTCTTSCPGTVGGLTHFGGHTVHSATYFAVYNQPAATMSFIMAVGILTGNATLIDTATKYFKAFLTIGTFSDGTVAEWVRWSDCDQGCSGSAWSHAGGVIASLVATADYLARTGDTSLYTFTPVVQTLNSPPGSTSLLEIVDLWAQMANKTVQRYATTSAGAQNAATLLSWDTVAPLGDGGPHYWDFGILPANLYYNDADVRTATRRNLAGSNTSSSCADAQFAGCFSSVWTNWPDLPFMYGKMEGVVNPYGGSRGPSVSLTASPASISSGQSSTLTWSFTNATSCTASGGWSGTKATSGSQSVTPIVTTTYTLSCTDSGGSATQSATVTLLPPMVPQSSLTIQSYASQETGYEATRAIDNNSSTFWHTQWMTASPDHPHQITVNLNNSYNVTGIKYMPRQDGETIGNIKNYEVYTSTDNQTYTLAGSGTFAADSTAKDVTFSSRTARYVRLKSLSDVDGSPYANAAEIQVYVIQGGSVPAGPSNLRILSLE